jgi:hypothetical protein
MRRGSTLAARDPPRAYESGAYERHEMLLEHSPRDLTTPPLRRRGLRSPKSGEELRAPLHSNTHTQTTQTQRSATTAVASTTTKTLPYAEAFLTVLRPSFGR